MTRVSPLAALTALILLSGCAQQQQTAASSELASACQVTTSIPSTEMSLSGLTYLGRYIAEAPFASSAAEIVSYDSCTDKLYVVNAKAGLVDVLGLDEHNQPFLLGHIELASAGKSAGIEIGAANSVATHNGLVAVAVENANKQANGIIALYRSSDLTLITTYPAGALPDMVSFSKDGRYIASANEGEPSGDYQVDPEGSITLIDLANGPMQAKVQQIDFKAFNEKRRDEIEKVRISGRNATPAQDIEPEYLTFADNGKLYVSLQENNALAIIDVASARIEKIASLGEKSWSNAQLDASNKDKKIGNFRAYPQLSGLYMPDSITSYQAEGKTYILSANEGDGREYGIETTQSRCDELGFAWQEEDYRSTDAYSNKLGFCISHIDEVRGKKLKVDDKHPLAAALKDNKQLARLKFIKPNTKVAANDTLLTYGARSFSIWDEHGELVFDSGDQFGQIASMMEGENFNSSNDSNRSADDRSDDKGIEPEAIEVAKINGRTYAFIGLERQGGIMVYDVSQPHDAMFITYVNHRDYSQPVCSQTNKDGECTNDQYNPLAGDLGPESIRYFQRQGQHLLAVGNEVSGTTSVYRLDF
ncbi:alkaline phosphatase [Vibrio navarrensis]|uniref:choice-of-anchor I family protein n=1 Tax=Vibrio navarrensis TaxID=29495 RepID=UPI0018697320|nr:choice-of-anchor I family protein [Vibrio navarrensis]MBE4573054.1 alkaline phosphatase [Vibrio navarrensis]